MANKKRKVKGMLKDEKAVLKRDSELKYSSDRLGPGSLMTQQSHINASRLIMVNHNMSQRVSIKDPEAPLVPSGFENKLASYNEMNDETDGDYEIVRKFEKNKYLYILIGYDKKRKIYHVWERTPMKEHSEGFATRYNNKYIDSLEVGDVVPKGTFIKKSESFDKYMNYQYGRNLNTVYMVSTLVYEDGITLMNDADKMMNTFRSHTVNIPLSENEVLLNLYGDDDHYQGLPNIGEKTYKGYLAVIRRIDGSKSPYALKKKRLREIERGDRKYYQTGRVIDIDILYNGPRNKISESVTNQQVLDLYDKQQEFYMELYTYMRDIVDRAESDGYTYTDEFSMVCMNAYAYVDSSAYFADNNDSIYGNMHINVRIMDEEKVIVGTKLVGRYGNKGVVNKIIPPEESWVMEDGTPIHAIVSALGIVGRLNQSQMNEYSINELGATAVEMMKQTTSLDAKCRIVYNLMKYLNSDEAEDFRKYYRSLSSVAKEKFCKRIERNGLTIFQHPIDNANIIDIENAYKEYPPNYRHIIYPDGGKSLHKVLCAKMFFIRLKQDPVEKYSARSQGPVNPLNGTPAKSARKKKHLDAYSDVAVRLGEQELEVMLTMVNHPAAVADFMAENSTSLDAKMALADCNYIGGTDCLTGTFDDDLQEMIETGAADEEYVQKSVEKAFSNVMENPWVLNSSKKNMEQIWAYLNELGIRIDIITETAPEGEYFED